MTARIYTIPARLVGEGMLLGTSVIVAVRGHHHTAVVRTQTGLMVDVRLHGQNSDQLIEVTLPGPSPRDTEENGGVCTCGAGAMGKHAKGCPADGLRLWPVGATWDPNRKTWTVPLPSGGDFVVSAFGLRDGTAWDPQFYGTPNEEARAAFCESEVQP